MFTATLETGLAFVLVSSIRLPSVVESLTHILSGGKLGVGRRGGEGGGWRGGGWWGGVVFVVAARSLRVTGEMCFVLAYVSEN